MILDSLGPLLKRIWKIWKEPILGLRNLGMSCPSWPYHRTGYCWSPVQTLPLVPLWCGLGCCSQTFVVIKLLWTSSFSWQCDPWCQKIYKETAHWMVNMHCMRLIYGFRQSERPAVVLLHNNCSPALSGLQKGSSHSSDFLMALPWHRSICTNNTTVPDGCQCFYTSQKKNS